MFDSQKKICIDNLERNKKDKSRKGFIDKQIIPLVKEINSKNDFYTTSSCSGRIYLLTDADKKPEIKWLYVTHEKASFNEIKKVLENLKIKKIKKRVWLRREGMILHICARTLEKANEILQIARHSGFRRSGIISYTDRIIVEICSTEKLDVPVYENGKVLVDEKYLKHLVKIANEKAEKSKEKINKFYQRVKDSD